MKILHIIDSLQMGGAEKLLLDSIPLYVKKGLKVDIALLHDNDYPFTQELEKQNCCRIYRLSGGSVYNPLLIFKLAKIINDYDVAHIHLFPAQYWVVFAKLIRMSKIKLVFTEHSTNNKRINNSVFLLIDKLIYKAYQKVIAISDPVLEMLQKKIQLPVKKIQLIYNGVNIEKYKKAIILPKTDFFDDRSTILIQVSSFNRAKDQKTLIKSLQFLPEKYCLLLVGDGELRMDCEQLVENLQLENRVKFLGRRTDVPSLLKTANIVVLSSHYEGLSLSSIEGMASGNPFIASNVAGLREIVNGYGLLFSQGNDKELSETILSLEDKEYYQGVVEKCQRRAEEFGIHKMIDSYIDLYKCMM